MLLNSMSSKPSVRLISLINGLFRLISSPFQLRLLCIVISYVIRKSQCDNIEDSQRNFILSSTIVLTQPPTIEETKIEDIFLTITSDKGVSISKKYRYIFKTQPIIVSVSGLQIQPYARYLKVPESL